MYIMVLSLLNVKRVTYEGPTGMLNHRAYRLEKTGRHTERHTALQRHNIENSKQIFPEKELLGHSPNFHIQVSVSDVYIHTISLPILLQENMWTDPGNI
jgi:hypothetical protein